MKWTCLQWARGHATGCLRLHGGTAALTLADEQRMQQFFTVVVVVCLHSLIKNKHKTQLVMTMKLSFHLWAKKGKTILTGWRSQTISGPFIFDRVLCRPSVHPLSETKHTEITPDAPLYDLHYSWWATKHILFCKWSSPLGPERRRKLYFVLSESWHCVSKQSFFNYLHDGWTDWFQSMCRQEETVSSNMKIPLIFSKQKGWECDGQVQTPSRAEMTELYC